MIDGAVRTLIDRLATIPPESRPPVLMMVQAQREQVGQAMTWLVNNLDRPQAVAVACAQLGPALAHLGVQPQNLQNLSIVMLDALRAAMGAGWRPEFAGAWQSAGNLATRWMTEGIQAAGYEPTFWSGTVVAHEIRRPGIAVLHARTHLPYPYLAGQHATVEHPAVPGDWQPYWIATAPTADNVLEFHVRGDRDEVGEALVYRTAVGDHLRLRPAGGDLTLVPGSDRDLLLVAGGVGLAPAKALLNQLWRHGDERAVRLIWGVWTRDDLYDLESVQALADACPHATVEPVITGGPAEPYTSGTPSRVVAVRADWRAHDAYVSGPPDMVRAVVAALVAQGVARERIRHAPC